jgi:uncharacterized BrkB/YihY/UPF0761 family membrane protein
MVTRPRRAYLVRLSLLSAFAAELAFFFALSVVPFLGITLALAGRWLPPEVVQSAERVVVGVLPGEAGVDADEVARWARGAGGGWLSAGFLIAVWTSFRFMSTGMRALSFLIAADPLAPPPRWQSSLRAVVLMLVWMAALIATAVLVVAAPQVDELLLGLPRYAELSVSMWAALRAVLLGLILFVALALTYQAVPGLTAGGGRVALAALVASVGWFALGTLFSMAVPLLWQGTALSGTLASIVLFLLWALGSGWIFLLGGLLLVRPARGARRTTR